MTDDDIIQGAPVYITAMGTARALFAACWRAICKLLEEGGAEVRVKALDARTAEQNSRMWAMLADISRQVQWHGTRLTADEWKCVFTASLKRQKVVPGLDGGFVVVGGSTSKMSKKMHSDLMELMTAFGNEREPKIVWSDPNYQSQMAQLERAA